jgi:UDP-N-acetylglucosamine:LPS N-acetylglucosamine transferase
MYETHKNIEIVFVPPTLEYKYGIPPTLWDHIRYSTNAVITGIKIIKKEKIEIIHSQNFFPILAGSVLAYLTSKPHIITIHNVFLHCGKNYWKS